MASLTTVTRCLSLLVRDTDGLHLGEAIVHVFAIGDCLEQHAKHPEQKGGMDIAEDWLGSHADMLREAVNSMSDGPLKEAIREDALNMILKNKQRGGY